MLPCSPVFISLSFNAKLLSAKDIFVQNEFSESDSMEAGKHVLLHMADYAPFLNEVNLY